MRWLSKPRPLRLLLLTCALLPLSAQPAGGQTQELGVLTGQVRVVRGDSPPEPVMVTLQARGITVNSTYTDAEGRFVFYGLPSNLYHVLVNDAKYQPVEVQVSVHPSIVPVAHVQISLDPRDLREEGKSPQAPASGGNPYLVSTADYTRDFPKKAVQEFDKAVRAEQAGKTDDAMRGYRKAIAIAPDFYPAHNQLGVVYLSRQDFPAAQAAFEEVLKLNQTDANAYFNLGNVFLLTGRVDDALRLVEEGLRKQPNSGLGKFLLGSAYRRAGRFPEAERALHDAIAFDPTLAKAHLELVNLYLHQRRTPDAIAELKLFLKTFPADPMAPQASQALGRLEGSPPPPPQ